MGTVDRYRVSRHLSALQVYFLAALPPPPPGMHSLEVGDTIRSQRLPAIQQDFRFKLVPAHMARLHARIIN